jgi:hypothetical protein
MERIGSVTALGVFVALCLSLGCSTSPARRGAQAQGSPPSIKHSFASKKVASGDYWKIYLEANDPDGDMKYFIYAIDQVGFGTYSPGSAWIKKQSRKDMRGYLRVFFDARRRFGSGPSEWTQLNFTLYIKDEGGNASNKVVLPLVFSQGAKQEPPPPPFDSGRLEIVGTITARLNTSDEF